MQIGRVKGSVVATRKSENMTGWKLLLVKPIDLDTFQEKGQILVAADAVGVGQGEVVMLTGGSPASRFLPCLCKHHRCKRYSSRVLAL